MRWSRSLSNVVSTSQPSGALVLSFQWLPTTPRPAAKRTGELRSGSRSSGKISVNSRWQLPVLLLLGCGLLLAHPIVQMHAQISDRMTSRTRVDEYDTAESRGGQIGGRLMGFGYKLLAMRCVSGQVIVGANIRRGDVLDYLQIVCAVPSCQNGSCSWSSPQLGMSAGNPAGGDPHPGMMCPSNQILSGIRGRVVSFTLPVVNQRTGFDYAADLEIECSQMTGPPVVGR